MAQLTYPPELTRSDYPSILSSVSHSDSEPELDLDPFMEPFFSHPGRDDHHQQQLSYFPNHHRDFTLMNHLLPDPGPQPGMDMGLGSGPPAEVNLELGIGIGLGSASSSCSSLVQQAINDDETRRFEGGLRVINLDSDSESDYGSLHDDYGRGGDFDFDLNGVNLGFGGVSDFDRPPFCWDYLGFNNNRAPDGGHGAGVVNFDDDNNRCIEMNVNVGGGGRVDDAIEIDESDGVDTDVSIVFDTYQEREEQREITIESDNEEEDGDFGVEDAIRDLEWEIMLAVNNFNREVYDMDFNVDMYEAILGEVEERMNEWRGSPPASEAVVESLPTVKLLTVRVKEDDEEVVCSICKEEVVKEEVVKQLPCSHYYHGNCILPWLKLRNTCPLCRFELPTDDAEYEHRRRERERERGESSIVVNDGDDHLSLESQVSSYDFHVFL